MFTLFNKYLHTSRKFLIRMFVVFFDLTEPASRKANPVCITAKRQISHQPPTTDWVRCRTSPCPPLIFLVIKQSFPWVFFRVRLGTCAVRDLFKGAAPGHHLSILETFAFIFALFGISDSSYIWNERFYLHSISVVQFSPIVSGLICIVWYDLIGRVNA